MMIRFALTLAASFALSAAAMAQTAMPATQRPVLKAEATVTGDLVRIGDLLETAGMTDVRVTRAARMIPASAVEEELSRALSEQYQLGAPKDITVNFDRAVRAMYVSPSALGEPRVSRLTYDARSGRFDADIDLPTRAASHGTLRLGGRAVA